MAENKSRQLMERLRVELVPPLCEGTWNVMGEVHRKVALGWRLDLNPGSGKPKYVERVLGELTDEEVIALAGRVIEHLSPRQLFPLEDAFHWVKANGVAQLSEVTRIALAQALDGHLLHPRESATATLDRFGQGRSGSSFEYSNGQLFQIVRPFVFFGPPLDPIITESTHLAMLDAYGFRAWPDVRLLSFLEYLVHPATRQSHEQSEVVRLLNGVLEADQFELRDVDRVSGHPIFRAVRSANRVSGRPKNLIFASTGLKPELGFIDAVNNDVVILKNGEHCLIYDDPIGEQGLTWSTLVAWWASREGLAPNDAATRKGLGERLKACVGSKPEDLLFSSYFKTMHPLGDTLPALLPQVYLHYDPVTLRDLRARGDDQRFEVQRMDFLLLLPHGVRVVVEVDGQQHYSTGTESFARPSPETYARTVRSDRQLRLAAYDVYRFAGYELRDEASSLELVGDFFTRLFRRHKLTH